MPMLGNKSPQLWLKGILEKKKLKERIRDGLAPYFPGSNLLFNPLGYFLTLGSPPQKSIRVF